MRKDQTYKSQVSQPQRTARSSHRPWSLGPQHTLELGADVGQFLVDSLNLRLLALTWKGEGRTGQEGPRELSRLPSLCWARSFRLEGQTLPTLGLQSQRAEARPGPCL